MKEMNVGLFGYFSSSTPSDRSLSALARYLSSPADSPTDGVSAPITSSDASSVFSHVVRAPEDPIPGVTVAYNKYPSPVKLNLGVGAHCTEEGKPLLLNVVRKAEQQLVNDRSRVKEYLPIVGLAEFNKLRVESSFLVLIDSMGLQTTESTSAWKSTLVFNSFLRGQWIHTEVTIEDSGYLMGPVDDALGQMKHVSEHSSCLSTLRSAENILEQRYSKRKHKMCDQPTKTVHNYKCPWLWIKRETEIFSCHELLESIIIPNC